MIAPIKEETRAIKTARQSALKIKFNPRGRERLKTTAWLAAAEGSKKSVQKKEVETRIKSVQFLKAVETRPKRGRKREPRVGTKTASKINNALAI
jgi:hypothetical protein